MVRGLWVAICTVLMLCVTQAALAQTRVALVIANDAYRNVPSLKNPPSDAALIAASLRKAGFTSVETVRNLDKASLEAALQRFGDKADGADVAMVYYAGHGIELGGQNYLIPVSARLLRDRDADVEAVALDTVLRMLESARLRLVVLDACRENPFAVAMARSGAGRSVGRGLARVEPEGETLVVYAARAGAIAADGAGANSPFATSLAQRIIEPGVEIRLLFGRVRDDVLKATGREQEPFTYGSLSGEEFYLVPGNRVAPPMQAALEPGQLDALGWQSALAAGTALAFQDYLNRNPNGAFVIAAQENLKRLAAANRPATLPSPAPPRSDGIATVPTAANATSFTLSKGFRAFAARAQQAERAGDYGTMASQLMEAANTASTADDFYVLNSMRLNLGVQTKDSALQRAGLSGVLASGRAPLADQPKYHYYLSDFALRAKDTADAITHAEKSIAMGYPGSAVRIIAAEGWFQRSTALAGNGVWTSEAKAAARKGLDFLSRAIEMEQAQGTTVPPSWYARGYAFAYTAQASDLARWETLARANPVPGK